MKAEIDIPELAFTSQMQYLRFEEVVADVLFFLFRVENGVARELLRERYVPNGNREIVLLDLDRIIVADLGSKVLGDFRLVLLEGGRSLTYNVKMVRSRVELGVGVNEFLATRYLTLLSGVKVTRMDAIEFVSLYSLENTSLIVAARYRLANGEYVSKKFPELVVNRSNEVITLDVSPVKYAQADAVLVTYEVVCGRRSQRFEVDNISRESAMEVVYANNFGVLESYLLGGVMDWENKYAREFGYFEGQYKGYNKDLVREYTAYTGVMPENMAEWIEDLWMSESVWWVRNGMRWKNITLLDAKIKRSSVSWEIPSFEFKFRLSQRNQEVRDLIISLNRIHDKTFDYTFN